MSEVFTRYKYGGEGCGCVCMCVCVVVVRCENIMRKYGDECWRNEIMWDDVKKCCASCVGVSWWWMGEVINHATTPVSKGWWSCALEVMKWTCCVGCMCWCVDCLRYLLLTVKMPFCLHKTTRRPKGKIGDQSAIRLQKYAMNVLKNKQTLNPQMGWISILVRWKVHA